MAGWLDGWMAGKDTLLALATGSYLAVQFSSICDLPAVFHIARIVPERVVAEIDDLPSAVMV